MFLATKTPDFQTESLPEGLYALPTKKERTTKGIRKTLFVLLVGFGLRLLCTFPIWWANRL